MDPQPTWAGVPVLEQRVIHGAVPALADAAWVVRELDVRERPGARGPRCLVFEAGPFARRVWTYPEHWVRLDDSALLRLALGP